MDSVNLESYTKDKTEASEAARYEKAFVERHEKDLNLTLALAILFSIVSAAIVIATRPELTDGQNTTLYHTIFLALNHTTSLGETPVIPPDMGASPERVTTAILFFYESSLVSLLAVHFAILAKECLSDYNLLEEVPAIDRSESHRRKFDALDNWRFCILTRSAHILLRVALAYFILGFWQRFYSAHPITKCSLTLLIVPGLVGYIGTTIGLVRMSRR